MLKLFNIISALFRCMAKGAIAVLFISLPSFAAEITPSHVFQSTQTIKAELAAMHHANFSEAKDANLNISDRRPRHVLQKAREVYLKIQQLKISKGAQPNILEPFPVRNVKPQDVKELVDLSLKELRSLRGAFGSTPGKLAELSSGKTPSDVYKNLADISVSINSLGIPQTVPNDVYQVALTVISDLEKIRKKKGIDTEVIEPGLATGKKPKDVYNEVLALIGKLQDLANKVEYAIPGGVIPLKAVKGRISPAHVLDALNNALAESAALKQVAGVSSPTEIAEKQSGKTPSDVFMAIKKAQAIVDTLL